MSLNHSPKVVTDKLILCLDAANIKSFRGEPTTNISYNNGQNNSQYLSSVYYWVNTGSWTYNENETDIPKPNIDGLDTSNLRIQSGTNASSGGSIHFGCGYSTVLPSTIYTASVYFRQNLAGTNQPYLRTSVTNVSLGNLTYNGNANASTWPINQWIRISVSGITASNENAIFISNYIGTNVGDKVWYFGHQVEQKPYMTHLVAGTRGSTYASGGGWKDLSGNNNHAEFVGSVPYGSSYVGYLETPASQITNYVILPESAPQSLTSGYIFTLDWWCVMKSNDGTRYQMSMVNSLGGNLFIIGKDTTIFAYGVALTSGAAPSYTVDVPLHLCLVADGTYQYLYKNGIWSGTYTGFIGDIKTTTGFILDQEQDASKGGFDPTQNTYGWWSTIKMYNKALSAIEVLQNFNAMRSRFGI